MAEMNITSSNFEELVLRSEKPVLLDFWATWCGPCLMLAPTIEKIAKEHSEIAVGKVNVDDDPSLAIRFGISSIPALLVFKNGELADKSIGVVSEEKILQMLGI